MVEKFFTCIICKKKFESTGNNNYLICKNPKCKEKRHSDLAKVRYQKKKTAKQIKQAVKLLQSQGYGIIAPNVINDYVMKYVTSKMGKPLLEGVN